VETDGRLIEKIRQGDRVALESLFKRHKDDVFRFALRLSGSDESLALDLAQDALLCAYEKLHSFRGASAFRTWLFGITYNLSRQQRRNRWRLPASSAAIDFCAASNKADDHARHVERRDRLNASLARLPDGQRNALYLCDILGCSYRETAAVLQISENAAKNRIHTGRKNMLEMMRNATADVRELLDD
jgi:RNA polymerase sigma-70 factor, ECF subfamily